MTSIRHRLTVGLALGVSVIWSCGVVLSVAIVQHEIGEVFDESLRETARRLLSLVSRDVDSEITPLAGSVADASAPRAPGDGYLEELLGYAVRDETGRIVLLSRGASESDFLHGAPDGFSRDADRRLYTESTPGGALSVQVSEPLWHRRQATTEAVLAIAALLPVLVALSLALGWLLTRYALAGVHEVRAQLEGRGGRNLEPLTLDTAPSELRPIVDSVNRMLGRLDGALQAERGAASTTAHELRTPIATALAQTQRLAATLPSGPPRERVHDIATTLHDLARLAEKLVQLGRAESGLMNTGERCDGAHIVPHVLDEFRRRDTDETRLRYRVVGEPRFESRLDPDGLAIVLRNLIENALKHGAAGRAVEVVLDGTLNTLSVVNDADVVPSGVPLRERFVRGTTTAPGAGLGLAIVDAVLHGTGLVLELHSPPHGRERGFEAVLREPRPTPGDGEEGSSTAIDS